MRNRDSISHRWWVSIFDFFRCLLFFKNYSHVFNAHFFDFNLTLGTEKYKINTTESRPGGVDDSGVDAQRPRPDCPLFLNAKYQKQKNPQSKNRQSSTFFVKFVNSEPFLASEIDRFFPVFRFQITSNGPTKPKWIFSKEYQNRAQIKVKWSKTEKSTNFVIFVNLVNLGHFWHLKSMVSSLYSDFGLRKMT